MKIRFWSSTSLPMYGSSVEELHLDIDGEHWLVVAGPDGKPVLKQQATGWFNPATGELEEA